MKYDYFERDGAARLYRIPRGQQGPVEFVCNGVWLSSDSFVSKTGLEAEGKASQVNAARAKAISDGAPVDVEPAAGPRYFWWDNGTQYPPFLLRDGAEGSFDAYIEPGLEAHQNYRNAVSMSNGWAMAAYKPGVLHMGRIRQITEEEARSRRPKAFEPQVRYFYNDIDIYRQTDVDTFHYWSDNEGDWSAPVTPGWEIINYPEITAEKAEALVLERTKVAAPRRSQSPCRVIFVCLSGTTIATKTPPLSR